MGSTKLIANKCFIFIVFFISFNAFSDDSSFLIHDWLMLESQRGAITSEWEKNKANLDAQISLYRKQIAEYKTVIESQSKNTNDLDERRKMITLRQSELEEKQAIIKEKVNIALHKIGTNLDRLPPFVKKQVSEELQGITSDVSNISKTVDSLVATIRMLFEHNEKITLHKSELKIEENNTNIHVTQVYVGLSHGWYVSEDNTRYGYGRATDNGWKWWHNEDSTALLNEQFEARDVRKLIDSMRDPQNARLSTMPLVIN